INHVLFRYARAGRNVVRLNVGDLMIFARGAEKRAYVLRCGIEVEIVLGASTALAVPALVGIALTRRGFVSVFTAIAGHRDNFMCKDWLRYAHGDSVARSDAVGVSDTLVIVSG